MKIIFMGTPEFAVPSLDICINEHDVQVVFTQPDKPSGRGHHMKMSDVKIRALEDAIDIYQPQSLKDTQIVKLISSLQPDVIVVVAYGQILTNDILSIPKYGCVNVHGSILPYYRGPAPIHWAVVNGEKITGVTTMYMDEGVDTGDILEIDKVEIFPTTTTGQLHDILKNRGAKLLSSTLKKIQNGNIIRTQQEHEKATYAPLLSKNSGIVDWSKTSEEIINIIRGFNPWPCAASFLDGKRVKLYTANVDKKGQFGCEGEIIEVSKEGLFVQALDGLVRLEVMGFPNKKPMHISKYLLGNNISKGQMFNNGS